jgi:hypothetical protein
LYWEELWEFVVIASNFAAEERNAEFKFQFMLHADKEAANKWKDLPIPFPETKQKTLKEVLDDGTGVRQLNLLAPHIPVGHVSQEKTLKSLGKKQTGSPKK